MNENEDSEILVTWDEAGKYHRVHASNVTESEDALFFVLRLRDGTEIKVNKRSVLKLEKLNNASVSPNGGT